MVQWLVPQSFGFSYFLAFQNISCEFWGLLQSYHGNLLTASPALPARVARPISIALQPFSKTKVASRKSGGIYIFWEVEVLQLDFSGLDRYKAGTQTNVIM